VAHPSGTTVNFFVDFEFRSRILQAAIGVVFNEAVRRMVGAFLKRARDVYGAPLADQPTTAAAAAQLGTASTTKPSPAQG
ncbi:MAG TPA: hypothetical protein VJK90_00555, partial [Acetobacteraceae bacterium]|nr:hypothetical protein [Acetobacteraceae bacterium]